MNINQLIDTSLDIEVSGISYDSRSTKIGDVFVALSGSASDGHDFALPAQEKGAVCVVCERDVPGLSVPQIVVEDTRATLAQMSHKFFGDPSKDLCLIGVTGTNGKTTVTYLLKTILESTGAKVGLIGTNQNLIAEKVIVSKNTTPESYELAAMFRQMAAEGCTHAVMEVSSHALDMHRVDGCAFDVGIFTNLTQDHLDFHKTMENYLNAKIKLFKRCKYGIINTDDAYGGAVVSGADCEVTTYGIHTGSICARNISATVSGVSFDCQSARITLGIPGQFSVYNALAAIGASLCIGIGMDTIAKALAVAKGVKGRAELIATGRDFSVIIDYAHSPDGLRNILESVRAFTKGRLVVLFGCGGDRDRTKRPIMGKIAGALADYCIVTSDNPRSEEPSAIIRDILSGMKNAAAEYIVVENRRDAIAYAIANAQPDDVIVLAGKGHETYQILADKTIHFDEREIIAEVLGQ